jgi:hypothetical protein
MRIAPLGWLCVLASCGTDSVDLTGVYRVDSAVGSDTCETDEAIEFSPFVRFTEQELFGQPFFAYDGCADEAATECSSISGLLGGFFEPIDGGWLGRASFSSGGGDSTCSLGVTRQTAILTGATLTIESTSHEDEVPGLSASACSPEEAERREDEMPCTSHQLVGATKL